MNQNAKPQSYRTEKSESFLSYLFELLQLGEHLLMRDLHHGVCRAAAEAVKLKRGRGRLKTAEELTEDG